MAGTKTAPAVTAATITENQISISVVDASGDSYSDGYKVAGGALPTLTLIETLVNAYQAATQASVYQVTVANVFRGSKNPSNAETLARFQAENGINMLFRDTDVLNAVQTQRLVAPVAATMVGMTDTPVYPLVAPMDALVAAYIAAIGAGYSLESLQYTGRRERKNNTKVLT